MVLWDLWPGFRDFRFCERVRRAGGSGESSVRGESQNGSLS